MARYSRFGNTDNTFGISRNSRFAGIKINPLKTTIASEETKRKIIEAKRAESRRETILALASA